MNLRAFGKRAFRQLGIEVRRIDPGASLGLFLVTLIRDLEIDAVLDVGANEGQFGKMLRGEGYGGQIVSFEPCREAFAALARAMGTKWNGHGSFGALVQAVTENWTAINYALGTSETLAELHVPVGGTDVASLRVPEPGALQEIGASGAGVALETVSVRRLDNVLPELTDARRLLLKIDTQGFDLEVIRGATGILDRVVAIQTELSFQRLYQGQPGWRETLDELEMHGFVVSKMFTHVHDKGWAAVEADCVLVRTTPPPSP